MCYILYKYIITIIIIATIIVAVTCISTVKSHYSSVANVTCRL
jgi:hypothetical protein